MKLCSKWSKKLDLTPENSEIYLRYENRLSLSILGDELNKSAESQVEIVKMLKQTL
jgi:hypothetical protein